MSERTPDRYAACESIWISKYSYAEKREPLIQLLSTYSREQLEALTLYITIGVNTKAIKNTSAAKAIRTIIRENCRL